MYPVTRPRRWILLLVAAVAAAGFGACSDDDGGSTGVQDDTGTELSDNEVAFLDEIFNDEIGSLGDTDYTNVGDLELVAGGEAFCEELATIDGEGAAEGIGPTHDDFTTISDRMSQERFSEANRDLLGDPYPQGPAILAIAVGSSAVHNFCPEFTDALG